MSSMTGESGVVVGGVDTHSQTHHAAVIDYLGREISDCEFPATVAGYAALVVWLRGFGGLARVGVEGTSSYGAGLARHLRQVGGESRPRRYQPIRLRGGRFLLLPTF